MRAAVVEGYGGVEHGGACAELALVLKSALAAKPGTLSFEEAAAIPMGGLTALQALRDQGELAAGEWVLIHGASGGVGHFVVQIARIGHSPTRKSRGRTVLTARQASLAAP